MLDPEHTRPFGPHARPASAPRPESALVAGWRERLPILSLRGQGRDSRFRQTVQDAIGLELPLQACTSVVAGEARAVWAGPDDWFLIGTAAPTDKLAAALRSAALEHAFAVTDVSSGYTVMHMSGKPVRDVLAAGCPLDLHPRVFGVGSSAGSHFFKASVWLWQVDDAPSFEVLVRRSFMSYFRLMLERSCQECGLVDRRFRPRMPAATLDARARSVLMTS